MEGLLSQVFDIFLVPLTFLFISILTAAIIIPLYHFLSGDSFQIDPKLSKYADFQNVQICKSSNGILLTSGPNEILVKKWKDLEYLKDLIDGIKK